MLTERLSIRQTFAQIGIQTTPGEYQITSPHGTLEVESTPVQWDMHSPRGELTINSDAAWSALAKGPALQWNNFIYSQMSSIALQGIARRVEEGNRMGDLRQKGNPFAEFARDHVFDRSPVQYATEASFLNVKEQYIAHPPDIRAEVTPPKISYTPQKPEIAYQSAKVDIHVQHLNTIDIRVVPFDSKD